MAYFFILPAFVIWLLFALGAVGLTKSASPLAAAYPYVWRVSLWASIGVLVANALLIALLALGFVALEGTGGDPANDAPIRFIFGLSAVVGPILVSAAGWFTGALLGTYLAHRHVSLKAQIA